MAKKRNREISTMQPISKLYPHRVVRRMAPVVVVLLASFMVSIGGHAASAFQLATPSNVRSTRRMTKHTSSLNAWNQFPNGRSASHLPSFLSFSPSHHTTTTTAGLTGSFVASALIMDDPLIEAHVLTDVAHVGLDLAVFMGQGVLALRLAAVIGRLCSMAADYIPDHAMVPEEFVFQVGMLALSCWGLLRAAFLPSVAAIASNLKIRDGKAFHSLFAPTGLTWNHYKAMTAVGAVDWVTHKRGDTVCLDDGDETNEQDTKNHVYWLYDGQMELHSSRTPTSPHPPKLIISRSNRDTSNAPAALLAEHRLLPQHTTRTTTATTARVTSETAVFLRVNVSRLKRFITDNDPTVAEAMRVLLVQGLDAKLEAHWSRMATQIY